MGFRDLWRRWSEYSTAPAATPVASSRPADAPSPAAAPAAFVAPPIDGASTISPYQPGAGRVMITNGGPHPPATWAQATAEHVAPIAPGLGGARYVDAMKLQLAIQQALLPHHGDVQEAERAKLAGDPAHLLTALDPEPHLDDAMAAIVAASTGTPWEEHFAREDVQAAVRREVGIHFASAQHIERSWHVDRTPAHPHRGAWLALWHPGHQDAEA